jgi:hypothetical protein
VARTDAKDGEAPDSGGVPTEHEVGGCTGSDGPRRAGRAGLERARAGTRAGPSWAKGKRGGVAAAWRERQGSTGGLPRMGLAQKNRKVFFIFLFSEFNFQCENISRKS